jgi:Arc/MetJ-type ribon-helix-helix transcriptional regulator
MRSIINISLPKSLAAEVRKEVKAGHFASTSEFFRHVLRLWNTEQLARRLEKADRDFKKGKNWKQFDSMSKIR